MNIDRLRENAKSATPGPWHWVDGETDEPLSVFGGEYVDDGCSERGRPSLRTTWLRNTESVGPLPEFVVPYAEEVKSANAKFIATFDPVLVQAMLDVIEAAEELAGQLEHFVYDDPPTDAASVRLRWAADRFREVAS